MADISGIVQTLGAVLISSLITVLVQRSSNKASKEAKDAELAAKAKTTATVADVAAQGQVISGEAKFREDQSIRITALEKRLDDMSDRLDESNKLREKQTAEAARLREADRMRYEAREDQLVRWGTWNADPPPREPPVFVWPVSSQS